MAGAIGSASNGLSGKTSRPRGGRGGDARGGGLKWKPRQSAAEVAEMAADGETSKEKPITNGAPKASEARACRDEPPSSYDEHAEWATSKGDQQHGHAGNGAIHSQAVVQSSSAGSSSGPRHSGGDGEFPGLPLGDASRVSRPTSSHAADSLQSHSHALAQQLKTTEQRIANRKGALLRLGGEIRQLQEEAYESAREEGRIWADSTSTQAQAQSQEEMLRERYTELQQKVKDDLEQDSNREARHRQWEEELSSMRYQQDAAIEQSGKMKQTAGAWHKAVADEARRLRSAEAKIKSMEAKREEHRSLKAKFHPQAVELLQARQDTQLEVEELRKTINMHKNGTQGSAQMWQSGCGVLFVILILLLLHR